MKKACFLALFCWSATAFATVDDVLSYQRIGDVALSPNGEQVAYTLSQIVPDAEGKRRIYSLLIQDKSHQNMITANNEHTSLPAWSPDGKFFSYIIENNQQQEFKILDLTTQKTQSIVSLKDRHISAYKWSPNSKFIAIVAEGEKKKKKLLTPINVKTDYSNSQIYLISVNDTTSAPTPITSDQVSIAEYFTPSLDGGFDWSPDSKMIAYAYQPRQGADYTKDSKIAFLNLDNHQVTQLPYTKDHAGGQPVYSPDGKWIAFHSNLTDYDKNILFYSDPTNNGQICVARTDNFATHCLANTFNENSLIIGWAADSNSIYAVDWYKSIGPQIYKLNLDASIPAKTISPENGFIQPTTIAFNAKHNYFAFGLEKMSERPQIYRADANNFKLEQLTHLQSTLGKNLGSQETIHWKSKDNLEIEGILIKPDNYDPKKKYPLLVSVHGGPAGAWGLRYLGGCDEFGDMILPGCTQNMLNLGFVILQPNYRGSSGYGTKFRAANLGDFGGGDYQDVMAGADYLIDKGIADKGHLAIMGWSYGGYMTNWVVTQTNRFKAAIAGAGLTDFVSFSGTSDIPYYLHYYLKSTLWDGNKLYLQRSPVLFSKNVTTPLLIMHGKDDVRVPVSQSYEFYTALMLQNKPVDMIVYPDQGHILTDGNIIYQSQLEAMEWLKKAI